MSTTTITPKRASRNYVIECAVTMGAYMALTFSRRWLLPLSPNEFVSILIKIMPAIPVWILFAVVYRYYQRIDEYERLRLLKVLAIAFGLTSCTLCSYTFLMDAGLPPLDITWAWPVLAVSWALTGVAQHIFDR